MYHSSNHTMKKLWVVFMVACFSFIKGNSQQTVEKANSFLSILSKEQKELTLFPFDGEERYNYHFVPIPRKGITLNDLNESQKKAALDLLHSCLSDAAFQKTEDIRQLEYVLIDIEKRKPDDHYRDAGNYHISIFGIPSANTIWGWRFEGHHMSFNFSFDKKKMTSGAPAFLGTNPAIVLEGPQKGKQVLKDEEDNGYAVLSALNASQLIKAIIDTVAYKDILSFDKRKLMLDEPTGIKYSELTSAQQSLLLNLISTYVHRFTKLFADDMLKDIQKDGLDKISFAWAGNTKIEFGKGTYYRVQGPGFLIEYDNTQNNANHVHSVLRDLKHDFGGDELLEHYRQSHQNDAPELPK